MTAPATPPPATPSPAGATGSGQEQWATAVDTYRSAAKWLITTFGSIGAVIAGTAPLAGIGDIHSGRMGWLLAGGVAALGGVTVVIVATVAVLVPQAVYGHELRPREQGWWARTFSGLGRFEDVLARHPEDLLPSGIESVGDLHVAMANLSIRYRRTTNRMGMMARGDANLARAAQAAANTAAMWVTHRDALADLLMVARFEKARTRFNQALVFILIGGVATALGLGFILYGISAK